MTHTLISIVFEQLLLSLNPCIGMAGELEPHVNERVLCTTSSPVKVDINVA
jgi:hypothetical protein